MVNDETFFAWLDGELDPTEASHVAAQVAADPRLSAMAADHRSMQARLKASLSPRLEAPVPGPLLEAVRTPPPADVIDLGQARNRRKPRSRPMTAQWGA